MNVKELFEILDKKILFIQFKFKKDEVEKYCKNAIFTPWRKLTITDDDIKLNGKSLRDFRSIFIGLCNGNQDKYYKLKSFIEKNGIKHLQYGAPGKFSNKESQNIIFNKLKLPTPKTIIGVAKDLDVKHLINELKLPIVSKIINGSKGKGIKKHDTEDDLRTFLNNNNDKLIFQEFIDNENDIRVFYVKDNMLYTISRTRSNENEFRNNISLGGKQKFINIEKEAKIIADKIRNNSTLDIIGIDLIKSKTDGKWYVLEYNIAPQFIDKDDIVIPSILKFL